MITLSTAHPEIATKFEAGNFTIQKTSRQFSANPIKFDQTREQNNAAIKGGVKTKPALPLCQMAVVSASVPSAIFWRA